MLRKKRNTKKDLPKLLRNSKQPGKIILRPLKEAALHPTSVGME
jgi:hypothetical protein